MKNNHMLKYKLIAKSIAEIRKKRGITQSELASLLGVSKSYISKIEAPNTNKTFSLELVFNVAEVLEVPVTELFRYIKWMQVSRT